MGYEVISVDDDLANKHFKLVEPLVKPKVKKYIEVKIEKIWRDKVGPT